MDNSQIENTINEIRKRSGTVTAFDLDKISNSTLDGEVNKITRRSFQLNEPIYEINSNDITFDFNNEKLDSLGISLQSLNSENSGDRHVWIHKANDKVLGVMSFYDTGRNFKIEIVAKNNLEPELCDVTKPCYTLIQRLEDHSKRFNHKSIRVNSTYDLVGMWEFYNYEMTGMPQHDDDWGQVFPMEKKF
jgi:hypothetical protein